MTNYGRMDLYEVTLFVGNTRIGVFDKMSGGDISAGSKKIRPGQTGKNVALGGPVTVEDITLVKSFDRVADEYLVRFMINGVGKERCVATKQPLDPNRNAFGRPLIYQGVLDKFTPGGTDSENGDADNYTIVVSCDGDVG